MAIQRSLNILSQQRVDCDDLRSIESASRNDFDQLIQGFVTGTSQGYFVRGFNILMAGAIGGAASGLRLNVDPGALLHIASSQSGTVLMVPSGTAPQILNSAINTIVDGAFAPSAVNYVSVEYERFIDDSTSAQVYLWNPTTKSETTKIAPRGVILRYRVKITTATPASNFLPVATVITDAGNNVVSIIDDRPMIGRLGRGGVAPNPFYTYPWPQGRTENPVSSNSSSIDPFSGGDKAIGNLKDWMDAVMSALIEIKGTTYWYSASASGSLESLRQDLGNTVITGKGSIAHGVLPSDKVTPTAAGQINWDQDINIRVVSSALTYKLLANASSTDITLSDDYAAYVTLVRGIVVSPNLIFTNGLAQVQSVGAIAWTGPLQAGDYLKLASDTDAGYYQILTVDSTTQVTLTTTFSGLSTGPAGAKGKYSFGSYQTSPVPSTNRHIYITTRELVPEGQDVFWLFLRTDNGGAQPRVYIRLLGTELNQGEDRDVSDTTSAELLKYMGAPLESSFAPQYASSINPSAVPQITDFLLGAASTISTSQYFFINSSGDWRKYYVWFKKDGSGSDPAPANAPNGIEVDITTGMTDVQVAAAFVTAMNGTPHRDFKAVQKAVPNANQVRVTNNSAGSCASAANFNVGAPFAITIFQTGVGIGNFSMQDGDSLTLAIKELDEAISSLFASLDEPNYDETVDIVASGATPPTSLNGPISSSTLITLPNNSRFGNVAQKYTVGKGTLEVYLNGQYLRLGDSWAEVGSLDSASSQIQILTNLVVGDYLEFRISSSAGGGGGGGEGPQGPPGAPGAPGVDAAGGPISISTKTSDYTVLLSDTILLADCTTGNVTFTLPTTASASGRIFYFKKIDSSANLMIIQANGSEIIDSLNTQSTNTQFESFTVVSDSSQWWII